MFNNLKLIRRKLGFTQSQVSDSSDIPIRSYQNYETNKRIPRVNTAIAIAKVLNTTVEELFENTVSNEKQ